MEPATVWALIISASFILSDAPDPPVWARDIDRVWIKAGIGAFSEDDCVNRLREAEHEIKRDNDEFFKVRAIECVPYADLATLGFTP